ncbi:hypothetical protein [Streptomyces albipurpureus]|uniref:Uncharacterized protein n=1 Tax=Streptomyces albipurpureus TaxID=2897419 RepID=A0ABT0UW04_9ACTN|nr:hypothetical protein [Streptomyces sp. CWNU-1]MCM2391825.1 hypothetical protein [Streptomyces sp. CWNU-1]
MTVVAVEITPLGAVGDWQLTTIQERPRAGIPELTGVQIVDVETLASASDRGCGNDNPYQ